jgi:hypothetical protein
MRRAARACIGHAAGADLEFGLGRPAGARRGRDAHGGVSAVFVVAGVLLVGWVLNDLFKVVLVPRAVEFQYRLSVIGARLLWRVWSGIALGMRGRKREDFLGAYAPAAFVFLVAVWLLALTFGYALILFGLQSELRPPSPGFGTVLYFAGSSVLTVGYGDIVAGEGPARFVALFATASGLGTVAISIAFLFALTGAFQKRERFVVFLDSRAGAPPSGLALLETYAQLGILRELPGLFHDSEYWMADVLDSHLAYPLLMFFRSSHTDESWVAVLGALLDAASLIVTIVENMPTGNARLLLDAGMHLTHDLAAYYDLPDAAVADPDASERTALCERLSASGFEVRDEEAAWRRFAELRRSYANPLSGIGARWYVATAMLVGARTSLPGHG